jgi:hypothetical protein
MIQVTHHLETCPRDSNAVKKRETPDARLANLANALSPRALDSVECTATEMCFSLANTPFCLDVTNGDFHDGVGTTGNALTGDYVLADGRKGNLYKGPYPQVTAGDGEAATTTGAGSAGGASETGSPAAGTGTTGDGAAASTPTATGAGASKPSATGGSATGGSAATPSKNAAAGMAGGVGVGGAMALLGAVLL